MIRIEIYPPLHLSVYLFVYNSLSCLSSIASICMIFLVHPCMFRVIDWLFSLFTFFFSLCLHLLTNCLALLLRSSHSVGKQQQQQQQLQNLAASIRGYWHCHYWHLIARTSGLKQNVCCVKSPVSELLSATAIFMTWQNSLLKCPKCECSCYSGR